MVVDNKGGGASIPAMVAGRDASPDGYTITMGTVGAMALNPFVIEKLPYDTIKDYQMVGALYSVPLVIVTRSNSAVKDLRSLLREAKARKVAWGLPGVTSIQRLTGEDLKKRAGVDIDNIVYKGSGPMVTDLLAGHIEFALDALSPALPHIQSGKFRALAVGTAQRVPHLPDVPTVAESGFPGFESMGWAGLIAPAATPRAIVDKVNADVRKVLAMPGIQARINEVGGIADMRTLPQWREFVDVELARIRTIVHTSGIKIE